MIKELQLQNYKTHLNTTLSLGNLTLLCGGNGVGKSSVIQSLLLLRQSYQKNRLAEGLDLNKPLCEIGTAKDAMHFKAEHNTIGIRLKSDSSEYIWEFGYEENNHGATFLSKNTCPEIETLKKLNLFTNDFQYLSAARLAPQESYPKDDYEVEKNSQISIEKGQGELVAHFLSYYSKRKVISELLNINSEFDDLLSQTTAWEREISNNINLEVKPSGKGFEIRYSFNVKDGFPTEYFRPENVGFGITYTLPLIVAILSASPGALIIIENPEAHLHPYSQSKLMELMTLAAQSGIQILIETHSDHILNGALIASKSFESSKRGIDKSNLKIYSFLRDETKHSTIATEVEVLNGGKIKNQPEGFFDQIETDLETLMGF